MLVAASPHFVRVASGFSRRPADGAGDDGDGGGGGTAIFAGVHASVAFATSPALALALAPVEVGDEVALRVRLDGGGAAAAAHSARAEPTRAYLVALFERNAPEGAGVSNATARVVGGERRLRRSVQRHRLCFVLPPRDDREAIAARVVGGWWAQLKPLLGALPSVLFNSGGSPLFRRRFAASLMWLLRVPALAILLSVLVAVVSCCHADRRERVRAERKVRAQAQRVQRVQPQPRGGFEW